MPKKDDDQKDDVDNEDDTSAGDDTSDENDNDDSKDNKASDGDVVDDKEPSDKESSRLKERLRDLTTEAKEGKFYKEQYDKLMEDMSSQKKGDDDFELSDVEKEDIARLKKLAKHAGFVDADSVKDLKEEISSLKTALNKKEDSNEKNQALKKFKAVIKESELDDIIEEWASSPDPRVRAKAAMPYEDIILLSKGKELAQSENEEADKIKGKSSKKIKTSDDGEKRYTTDDEDFKWDPSDPVGSEARMLKKYGL